MTARISHRFVRALPDRLEADVLYVSLDYLTTGHLCACGCGEEVILPLHPTKWRMSFDGSTVSIRPSVGSRTLGCRSHYLITHDRIVWADPMSDEEFDRALARDQRDDDRWHGRPRSAASKREFPTEQPTAPKPHLEAPRTTTVGRMRRWIASWTGR